MSGAEDAAQRRRRTINERPIAHIVTMEDSPRPKRRRFQFSLRALLVLVLLISIGMSWLVVRRHRVGKQRTSIETIKKMGGQVESREQTRFPPWLHAILGDDFFFVKVNRVSFIRTKVGDAGLEHISELTRLQWLFLNRAKVTDAGLEHLKGLTSLKWLQLKDTRVTDAGADGLSNALPKCYVEH